MSDQNDVASRPSSRPEAASSSEPAQTPATVYTKNRSDSANTWYGARTSVATEPWLLTATATVIRSSGTARAAGRT
ncbi:hypothetical protein [Streptomyces shenzhenensis]|uniref:hypothetical protein n=1 Tax=Streptomyces shenzhenensis TaxID=943815 RepID=UPI003409B430